MLPLPKNHETFYTIIERNFYSAMEKILLDEYDIIKEDFYREKFGPIMLLQN